MDGLKFYYMIEFPTKNSSFPKLNLDEDFPGIRQAIAGSVEYKTYDTCTAGALKFLKSKLEVLNADDNQFTIFFEKNQFDDKQNDFEENEIVKIYIADSLQSIYNSVFQARVFFVKTHEDSASYFDSPRSLQ
jgi:hypothetical protein